MATKPIDEIITHLKNGIKYKKCWKCGCQQGTVNALEGKMEEIDSSDKELISPLLEESKKTFEPVQYDCLGCKICYPSEVTNFLSEAYPDVELEPDGCATDDIFVEERSGWPPLPGSYEIIRFEAPVAICTLNSKDLMDKIVDIGHSRVSIVGTMNTENLGIERVVKNLSTNPNVRFLILCGDDSEQKIGHLPGQSLVSLFENGVNPEKMRIIGAKGKRPLLKNVDISSINQIKEQVKLINLVGCSDLNKIEETINECASQNIPVFEGAINMSVGIEKIQANCPPPLKLDPSGYFVIYPDKDKNLISVEHYTNNGVLNKIVEGRDIGSIYSTIIENNLISKLDHASYLGKELAKADEFLRIGTPFIQDKAQDPEVIQTPTEDMTSNCKSKKCC